MDLIGHVTYKEHLIEGHANSLVGALCGMSPSGKVLVTIDIVIVELCFCHFTSRDQMFKGYGEFIGGRPNLMLSCHLGGHSIYQVNSENHVVEGS